jgi:hypothetical protein
VHALGYVPLITGAILTTATASYLLNTGALVSTLAEEGRLDTYRRLS